MSSTIKRALSLFLCAALLFGALPLAAVQAADPTSGTCGDNLTWNYNTSTATLTISGTGTMSGYSDSYYNYTYVTTAPWRPYYNTMQTLVINSGVTSIGSAAFCHCTGLTSVTIGNSITSIGGSAFYGCTGLTSVTIPDSVTSIGKYAFHYCTGLTAMSVSEGNPNYSSDSFGVLYNKNKTKLIQYPIGNKRSSFTIPASVTWIGYEAFYYCTSLTSVAIPDSVTSIGEYAFSICTGLTAITVSADNPNYSSDSFGVLYNKNKTELIQYPVGNTRTSFTIPDSVTSIGSYAFRSCTGLTSVTIPNSVTSIGSYAFSRCTSLTSVTIPASVTSIGDGAFARCEGLTSVTIPDSVTRIGSSAFYDCTGLTSVTIGNSVTSIGSSAFEDCTGLTSVTIPDSVTSIGYYAFWGCTKLSDVYYGGSESDRQKMSIGAYNEHLLNATWHYADIELTAEEFLLNGDATIYSKNLALYCAELCEAANSNNQDGIVAKYNELGFQNVEPKNYSNIPVLGEIFSASCYTLGCKTVGNTAILCITMRGTNSAREITGDILNGDPHPFLGHSIYNNVYEFEKIVWSGLSEYVENSSVKSALNNASRIAILVTGHSLGGAAANALAASINTILYKTHGSWLGGADKVKLFAYTFGAIKVLSVDENVESGYENIHNIYNRFDTYSPNGTLAVSGVSSPYAKFGHTDFCSFDYNAFPDVLVNHSIEKYREAISHDYVDLHCQAETEGAVNSFTQEFTIDGKPGKMELSFSDDWCARNPKEYNHELCRFTSKISMLGYDNEHLEQALTGCGFHAIQKNFDTKENEVNYFIACKRIWDDGKPYNLIFAGFIGTHQEQWKTDFDPGYNSLGGEVNYHKGFLDASSYAKIQLIKYINDNDWNHSFSKENTKILLTGHSRGAATANLLAAQIIDDELWATENNVYAYTFATPTTTTVSAKYNDRYLGIFNIVNPEDIVTKFMPWQWGFGRYGRTFTLPSKTNCEAAYYKPALNEMKQYFSDMTNSTYSNLNGGEEIPNILLNIVISRLKSTYDYCSEEHLFSGRQMAVRDVMKEVISPLLINNPSLEKALATLMMFNGSDEYPSDEFYKSLYNDLLNTAFDKGLFEMPKLADAHIAQTYCAWVCTLPEKYLVNNHKLENGTCHGEWGCYKGVANCPVDVEIYDKGTGEVLGRIVNNEVDEAIAAKTNSVVMTVDGDSKSFWLPSNGDYEIRLIGNDNGKMDYSLIEINSDIGEISRSNFFDVNITKGSAWIGETASEDYSVDEHTLSAAGGSTLRPTEIVDDSEKTYTITLNVEGSGSTSGSRTAVSGDYVAVTAQADEGSSFAGWYENGSLISMETEYAFVAKSDRDLTAKFEEIKPTSLRVSKMPSKTVYTFKKDTSLDLSGMELEVTYSNGSKKTITDTSLFKVSGYSATPKGEKTITVEYEGLKTEFKVTVNYSWRQWLIIFFLFGWIWYK